MRFEVFQPRVSFVASLECALVRFFASMPSHVDYQHVLRLERLLVTLTLLPSTHVSLLVRLNVILVDVVNL